VGNTAHPARISQIRIVISMIAITMIVAMAVMTATMIITITTANLLRLLRRRRPPPSRRLADPVLISVLLCVFSPT
jgi:hypothetical protein